MRCREILSLTKEKLKTAVNLIKLKVKRRNLPVDDTEHENDYEYGIFS